MSDEGSFSVRLVDEDGYPIGDRSVTVFYGGFLSGYETQYTDSDGWAEFPTFGHSNVDKIYSYELHGLLVQKRDVLLSDGESIFDGATFSFTIQDE